MHKSNLKLRSALLMGAVAVAGLTVSAFADDSTQKVETVVVTGSRIATTNATADAPLTFVSSEAIKQTKAVTMEQVFNKLPAVSQTGSTDQNSIAPGGISTVDLRGIGSNRTLILINGQRMVSTFSNGAQGQDMANIPMSMIDHVEVLKDGASPIYGADAIGGVINIITKKNFNGVELNASGGISSHGDHASQQISGTLGMSNEKMDMIFSLEYSSEDPVRQSARKWAHGKYTTSSYVPSSQYIGETTGDYYTGNDDSSITSEDDWQSFNTGKRSDLIQGRGIINATLTADYHVTPNITVTLDSFYTNRRSSALLNPEPVGAGASVTTKWTSGLTIPTSNPNNTTGEVLDPYKRLTEVGNRDFHQNVNTYQERLGIAGTTNGWSWDAGYMYGESDGQSQEKNAINLTKLQQLVGNADCDADAPDNCGSVTLSGTGSLTSDDVDFISYTSNTASSYVEQIAYADISGELPIALQGGNIGVAFGVMYRGEAVSVTPDSVEQNGDASEGNTKPTSGNYNVKGAYGEVKLPVLKDEPFAKNLTFDFAGRYSYYSTSGHGTVYKGSMDWAVNDSIRFRAGYGTGERAPQVGSEMFLGDEASADSYTDPCESATDSQVLANCSTAGAYTTSTSKTFSQTTPQLTATYQGNKNLKPEQSIQYNFGVVLTPDSIIPGLTITADYYNIHLKDMIGTVSASQALTLCYQASDMDSNPYCQLFGDRSTTGQITTYTAKTMNLGWEHTDGIDFSVSYNTEGLARALSLPDGSLFNFDLSGVWLNNMKQENLDGSTTQYAGQWVDNAVSYAYPKYKANLGINLYLPSGASVGVTERFISAVSYYEPQYRSLSDMHAPDMFYTDFVTTIPWKNYTATFGIDNVFDKDPPIMQDYYVQTISNQYDMVGRYLYLRLGAKF